MKPKIHFECDRCFDVTSWTWEEYKTAPVSPTCRGCRRDISYAAVKKAVDWFKKNNPGS